MTEQDKRPKVGVGVIIINPDGLVLLGHRTGSHGAGTWGLPGGHLEFGEKPEERARIEIFEETGITDLIFAPGVYIYTNDVFNEDKHYITLYLVATHFKGTPVIKEPNKCLEWRWCCWDELPEPHFLPLANLLKTKFDPFAFAPHKDNINV